MRTKALIIGLVSYALIGSVACKKSEVSGTGNTSSSTSSDGTSDPTPIPTPAAVTGLKENETLPGFTLPDTKGAQVSLSSFKGNYVVIYGFNTWCGICLGVYNSDSDYLYNRYKSKTNSSGQGFKLVGISGDTPSSYPQKAWPQVYDKDGKTMNSYWAPNNLNGYYQGDGQIIVLDPDGKILYGATGYGTQDGVTKYNGQENYKNMDTVTKLLDAGLSK